MHAQTQHAGTMLLQPFALPAILNMFTCVAHILHTAYSSSCRPSQSGSCSKEPCTARINDWLYEGVCAVWEGKLAPDVVALRSGWHKEGVPLYDRVLLLAKLRYDGFFP